MQQTFTLQENALSDEQILVLKALARGATRAEAASQAGVSERTVYNYLKDPAFQAALAEARQEYWTGFLSALKAEALNAVRVLAQAVAGESVTQTQLKAAQTLVTSALQVARYTETEELRAELERLKADLGMGVPAA
jgi:transposase